ncbi:MAG TPA: RNA polymerase sigma factor region1.1 domain-containing protein, partial [Mycobacterium sp.]|nr:RNA polymerase sigma factor region1.1 domain-containing protein [Mycobacterium sp.]
NDHLPDKLVDAETLEVVISMLSDMGVAVYEQTPDAETLFQNNVTPTATTVEEAEEEAEAALSTAFRRLKEGVTEREVAALLEHEVAEL